jgi:hypothetical protein
VTRQDLAMGASAVGLRLRISLCVAVLASHFLPSHPQALEPTSSGDGDVQHGKCNTHRRRHPEQRARERECENAAAQQVARRVRERIEVSEDQLDREPANNQRYLDVDSNVEEHFDPDMVGDRFAVTALWRFSTTR